MTELVKTVHPKMKILSRMNNAGIQTILAPIDFHYMDNKFNGSQWQLFGYQHSSNYLLCSTEQRTLT